MLLLSEIGTDHCQKRDSSKISKAEKSRMEHRRQAGAKDVLDSHLEAQMVQMSRQSRGWGTDCGSRDWTTPAGLGDLGAMGTDRRREMAGPETRPCRPLLGCILGDGQTMRNGRVETGSGIEHTRLGACTATTNTPCHTVDAAGRSLSEFNSSQRPWPQSPFVDKPAIIAARDIMGGA